ncbi:hypothetical protein [Rhodococcus oxybenzonivorans]|uniref:hypothetical protein n=1 Tax=Rhodococcus oxybenzonivorans TaxID=1990687 RepID=UPI001950EE0F
MRVTGTGRPIDPIRRGPFSLFVLIGNPLIVVLIMAAMRYPVRVGFLAGLTIAQISEFSLILAALGLSLGHISNATVSLITVVGLATIGGSSYLILYSHQLYHRLERWLRVFEWTGTRTADVADDDSEVYVILLRARPVRPARRRPPQQGRAPGVGGRLRPAPGRRERS